MSDDRQNVVLVTVDSLRADHCGFHGYEKDTTPTLDSMADDGLIFENAIAPGSATPESMSAVHTGEFLRPYNDNEADSTIVNRRENVRHHLGTNPAIAEVMSDAGYETIGFSPNPFTSRHFGFDRGFDHYEDFLDSGSALLSRVHKRIFERFISGDTALSPVRLLLNWYEGEEIFKSWEQYYDDVIARTREAEEPFFLWVFLLDTHLPYLVERDRRDDVSWLDMWRYNLRLYTDGGEQMYTDDELADLLSLYDSTVELVDEFMARLTNDLGAHDPVYVFHGDHGEAFGEHGTYGHKPYVYDENVRVPYLVSNGNRSGRVTDPVSLRSIPATVAESAGIDHPFTVSPAWEAAANEIATVNPFGMRSGIRGPDWKYIWGTEPETDEELYRLDRDPTEADDVSDTNTELRDECRRLVSSRLDHEREALAVDTSVEDLLGEEEL